ncbi:MAG: hypothetical protein JXA71_17965, partial [Chitinispirillaceae bacterium]|nr:hypothetical protein [Chitinispirillaceae bacterium]
MRCSQGSSVLFRDMILLVGLFIAVGAWAQNTTGLAPLTKEFREWRQGRLQQALPVQGSRSFGYIPSPVTRPARERPSPASKTPFALSGPPESFDLRTSGAMTPVKNQGSCGSCWTFGTFGSLESWLLKHRSETWDFSEQNLKNTHGFDLPHCGGGNYDMSAASLARWNAPVAESDDPFNASSGASAPGLPVQKYVSDIRIFSSTSDIKNALMTHGALGSYMYYSDTAYHSSTNSFYYSGDSASNHAVTLAGWDDTRSVSGAPNNGAWLIKNSWGTGWGDNGYFWISYSDSKAVREAWAFTGAEDTSAYTANYCYDTLGLTGGYGFARDSAWGAALFSPRQNEYCVAIGIHAIVDGTAYSITLYDDFSGGSFSGLLGSVSDVCDQAGYYTIPLPSPVSRTAGDQFGVVVKFKTPGYDFPIPIEYPVSSYS